MDNTLSKFKRYDLLCRALFANNELEDKENIANLNLLNKLYLLLENNLMDIIKLFPHTNFLMSYSYLKNQIENISKLILFPPLLNKSIVAFGGGFSAGKSSLINSILGKKLLISHVEPTTNMPTYIFAGEKDEIFAVNLKNCCINLTIDEFQSLTHSERETYNSEVSKSLFSAAIKSEFFSWDNLVFMDTPGYSGNNQLGGISDREISLSQFNFAQFLIWVINAKNGVISASDIEVLNEVNKTNSKLPKLILLTRADQIIEKDINAIIEVIKTTLKSNNISFLDVLPVSNKSDKRDLLEPVFKYLESWNKIGKKNTYIDVNCNNIKTKIDFLRSFLNSQQEVINKYFSYVNKLKFNTYVVEDTNVNFIIDKLNDFEKRFFINLDKIKKNLSRNSYKIFSRRPKEFENPNDNDKYESIYNSISALKDRIDNIISPIENLKTLETKINDIANKSNAAFSEIGNLKTGNIKNNQNELKNTILNIDWEN